jgi:cytochrome c2
MTLQRCAAAVLGAAVAVAASLPATPSLAAAGNPEAGQKAFATRCAACHSAQAGQNKVGPSLAGIVGSKAGTVPDYSFSPAMKSANITWDDASLDKFLANPSGVVHGTKMFVSLPNGSDRANVIAYLNTLKK